MITIIYAGLLALLYVCLTFYVIHGRYKYKVGIGDGGNPAMARRVRIHGNFAEYVPIGLLLLFLVDYSQTSPLFVHSLGLMLLIGRLLHVWGLCCSERTSFGRLAGMILTVIMIVICAIILIWKFIALRLTGF
jgi:uncharacterized membrane protein YecN with MAPEG domain